MIIRLQGFDSGVFGGNFHTHNSLHVSSSFGANAHTSEPRFLKIVPTLGHMITTKNMLYPALHASHALRGCNEDATGY